MTSILIPIQAGVSQTEVTDRALGHPALAELIYLIPSLKQGFHGILTLAHAPRSFRSSVDGCCHCGDRPKRSNCARRIEGEIRT